MRLKRAGHRASQRLSQGLSKSSKQPRTLAILLLVSLYTSASHAVQNLASIIIDDLGNNYELGHNAVSFPAPITLAILPQTNFAEQLAVLAHKNNKEVMLHLPLQSVKNHTPTPGALSLHMTHHEFMQQLKTNLASVPHIRGVNNHMGSLLTQHPGHMNWLMAELSTFNNLYFIDSLTSKKSVAAKTATQYEIPNLTRDVFLDPDYSQQTLKDQFNLFISIVKRKGHAIAIAHPHRKTFKFIKENLSKLEENNIELVPVSRLIKTIEDKSYVSCTGAACTGL